MALTTSQYELLYMEIGISEIPRSFFTEESREDNTLFDLSSHARAREAIAFGLKLRSNGFHVFVVGEDRSGCVTATLDYLNNYVQTCEPPPDWVYVNNFRQPHKPIPLSLPNGMGCKLKKSVYDHIKNIEAVLKKAFTHPVYLEKIDKLSIYFKNLIQEELKKIRQFASKHGFNVIQTPEGFHLEASKTTKKNGATSKTATKKRESDESQIKEQLNRLTLNMNLESRQIRKEIEVLQITEAKYVTGPLWERFRSEYEGYLGMWINEFEADTLQSMALFMEENESERRKNFERYAINLFVDNQYYEHPRVLIEANPSHENLFGAIKHRVSMSGAFETNFTMLRAGSLHKVNGGMLILRAEALAKDPDLWEKLKVALRDRVIRIQDSSKEGPTSLLIDAPSPKVIPLDVQVFIIGQSRWYYGFFFNDPEFRLHFKIKGDIDLDLDITRENVRVYKTLIQQTTKNMYNFSITMEAVQYLTQCSSRWAEDRSKLSGRFELIYDVIAEAIAFARLENTTMVDKGHIRKTLLGRRSRNSRVEEQYYENILKNIIYIDTVGRAIGQVNALTVLSQSDHQFGLPARISARTFMGHKGVINIERLTEMSGPIQQKGAFILEGFLSSAFAQKFPLSYSCSLTFEQGYYDVEGDSASLAELCAILSSLSEIPLRQDLAITGSVDQFGMSQAVGGIHHKVEGFFEICQRRRLTGTQGVIVPYSNREHLTVKDEVVQAVKDKAFHIYTVKNIHEALELLTGIKSEITKSVWGIKYRGIYHKVYKKLESFHKALG